MSKFRGSLSLNWYWDPVNGNFVLENNTVKRIIQEQKTSGEVSIFSYQRVNQEADKVARYALNHQGLKRGDVVAVMMRNEPEFIWIFLGLAKIGVIVAFINYNLRADPLKHCLRESDAKVLIVGKDDDLLKAVEEINTELLEKGVDIWVSGEGITENIPQNFSHLQKATESSSSGEEIPRHIRQGITLMDPLSYVYTSGTTGLPKPAIITHLRYIRGAFLMAVPTKLNENDIVYTSLPLYHSMAGVVGLSAVILRGATIILRAKFSASNFWYDIRRHGVTVVQYIGEICRYVLATPQSPLESRHVVRCFIGNGLRSDIWLKFQSRFKLDHMVEFYASTEGNCWFSNTYNKPLSCGRLSPFLRLVFPSFLVKYDHEKDEPVRNEQGRCIPVEIGEPGLLIAAIKGNFTFEGYKGNKGLTEKKILRNVFQQGDAYFNSGDLLYTDSNYFLYFSDRVGDTFRWKGENVSTLEVANVLAEVEGVEDASVYGVKVPGKEGRAGMAAVTLQEEKKLTWQLFENIYNRLSDRLPAYARPLFLRVQHTLDLTGTYKQRKEQLKGQGFKPSEVKDDKLYFLDETKRAFVPLDAELYERIIRGEERI
ncbi:very long-chain acyl-CoA synthetase [Lingula anatina]|uniref:Very long-chain fatty acid transport protein n=1 Tax=Lingula anatina TaxID=7574 RepID=A0A2R2MK63_LINAN|nr:very long-chain acyl-CoA synthetase [Lingula anatina]|eukprot:XP_023930611.1 very long-chain acyl-CoA synthetase [Lingula anatina]